MSGRTPAAAVNIHRESIQRAFSCVTTSVPHGQGGYHVSPDPHIITLGTGSQRVRLSGESRIHIRYTQYYRIAQRGGGRDAWRVITTGYFYALDDAEQREIIAFHWHPDQQSDVVDPHLHLGPGARIGYDRLHRAHIPTGLITIQDVLKLAITDLGVEPLIDREAALQVLADTRIE